MRMVDLGNLRLHVRIDGPDTGPALVFVNSLGTDLRLWDQVVALLPSDFRVLRFDMRGHGLSDCPPSPYAMSDLVDDTARLIERTGFGGALVVGLSIGGMVAQGLAAARPDLVRAVVLSNTGARIGTPAIWAERIALVAAGGVRALAPAILARWFAPDFRESLAAVPWRHMLERTPPEGYAGCAAAIAGADLAAATARLRLPVLGIAGSADGSTPPSLVRETVALVPGGRVVEIAGAGHLPCVDHPSEYARILLDFQEETAAHQPAATDRH